MELGSRSIERKKILSLLPVTRDIEGPLYSSKLYSSDEDGEDWLFSGIEGYTCIIVDYLMRTKYIAIFHRTNYAKIFQYELYNGFENYFEELAPDFRSFEIDSGFIGLQFDKPESAKKFSELIKGLKNKKNIFEKKMGGEDPAENTKKFNEYCSILKGKFSHGGDKKYDEQYAEDGMLIMNHKNFKVLNNISYSKKEKKFKFGKISKELRDLFLSFGIKKKLLEKDVDFAFDLFKRFIIGLGNNIKLKNRAVSRINHSFLRPEEREKVRQKEANDLIKNKRLTKVKKKRDKTIKEKNKVGKPTQNQPPPKSKESTTKNSTTVSKQVNRGEQIEQIEVENKTEEKHEFVDECKLILIEALLDRNKKLHQFDEKKKEEVFNCETNQFEVEDDENDWYDS